MVATVRQVVSQVGAGRVRGLGFTGTCSLVLVADTQLQLCGGEQEQGWDVIMWMDHRAQVPPRWSNAQQTSHLNYIQAEADEINSTGHRLLDYVGGAVSLEMQMPKLLWLKVDSDNITAVLTLLL